MKKSRFKSLTGQVFNGNTVLNLVGKNKYLSYEYEILCECGNKYIAEGNDVKTARRVSCGCKRTKNSVSKCNLDPYHALNYNLYSDYKKKAEYRNIDFNLSFEEFKELTSKSCVYCGIEHSNIKTRHRNNKIASNVILHYNGIDRVDNTKGYTKENSVSCCKICNQAKHTMTENNFIDWIFRASDFLMKKQLKVAEDQGKAF
jgi:hypothetical protein